LEFGLERLEFLGVFSPSLRWSAMRSQEKRRRIINPPRRPRMAATVR
jgi:hypothetical protein